MFTQKLGNFNHFTFVRYFNTAAFIKVVFRRFRRRRRVWLYLCTQCLPSEKEEPLGGRERYIQNKYM